MGLDFLDWERDLDRLRGLTSTELEDDLLFRRLEDELELSEDELEELLPFCFLSVNFLLS